MTIGDVEILGGGAGGRPCFGRSRLMIRSLILALALIFTAPFIGEINSVSADEVKLTAELQAKLEALPTLNTKPYKPAPGAVTLVTFFASWCPPCREEFKHLNRLRADFSEHQFQIVAINILENWQGLSNPGKLKRFLKATKPSFVTIKGNDAIAKAFEDVTRLPTVFVFDPSGNKALHFIHEFKAKKMALTYEELLAAVSPLVAATKQKEPRT